MLLSRIDKINIRDVWRNETSDFNAWLFKKENIKLLGEEIGVELLPLKKEMKVNKGRIDILATDKYEKNYILIENQIAEADHHHLAKILDYIHSINPDITIWITSNWKQFHINTIKIIQNVTSLFVVKVEVLKIGNSNIGVKFTTIIEPDNWSIKRKKYNYQKSRDNVEIENFKLNKTTIIPSYFEIWFNDYYNQNMLDRWVDKKNIYGMYMEFLKKDKYDIVSVKGFYNLMKQYCLLRKINFYSRKMGSKENYYLSIKGNSNNEFAHYKTIKKII